MKGFTDMWSLLFYMALRELIYDPMMLWFIYLTLLNTRVINAYKGYGK